MLFYYWIDLSQNICLLSQLLLKKALVKIKLGQIDDGFYYKLDFIV